jgi:hypothetical protein
MSCGNVPNFNSWLQTAWGAGQEYSSVCTAFYGASNLVFGQNPPYYLDDFKAVYPKFFGLATALSGCTVTAGSKTVTVPSMNGLDYGQFLQAWGLFPKGTVICGLGNNEITLNNAALASSSNATLQVYQSPPVPTGVILLYLNLAYASLVQARWQEQWPVGMALYIAHFLTLYAKSDSSQVFETLQTATHGETPAGAVPGTVYTLSAQPPGGVLQALTKNGKFLVPSTAYTLSGNTITLAAPTVSNDVLYATWLIEVQAFTSGQPNGATIAAQGLFGGTQVSKSVGDVSVSYAVLDSLKEWGTLQTTTYGTQLATVARVVGSGPMVIWALLLCVTLCTMMTG